MTTIRTSLAKWAFPLAGIWFLLFAFIGLAKASDLNIVLYILAVLVGICCLAAS